MKNIVFAIILLFFTFTFSFAFAESVPEWVKNTAGWWSDDAISETEFVNAIKFLVMENIIQVEILESTETSSTVPEWVKNTAGWWSDDAISETEFVNAISHLIKIGVIDIETKNQPKNIAEKWINNQISDEEFLSEIKHMIPLEQQSELPSWLTNNAGLWAANILTDSNFIFDHQYLKQEIYPCIELSPDSSCFIKNFNSHGLRGSEFNEQKQNIDFRIFALGGSTTFGTGSNDDETWPGYLQRIINKEIPDQKIEVINAGLSGATSKSEYHLVRDRITNFEPDLIIMYDGWNDSNKNTIDETLENWKSVCELGKKNGFDVIVVVQPMSSTGYRVLTDQEIMNSFDNFSYIDISQKYVESFNVLENTCTKTEDFRRIFDYVYEPIYWDGGHTTSSGNKIIAVNIFSIISSHYYEKPVSITNKNFDSVRSNSILYAVGSDFSRKTFDGYDLKNAIFDRTNLSHTSFKNTQLDGARFVFANLTGSNLFDKMNLSNVNLAGVDIGSSSLNGKDLSGANLSYVDLSNQDLEGTNLTNVFLLRTDLSGNDLRQTPLENTNFRFTNLSGSKLPDSILTNNDFYSAELKNMDFGGKNLSNSIFSLADFEDTNMIEVNVEYSSFVDVDFSQIKNKSLKGANMDHGSFSYSSFVDVELPMKLEHVNFNKAKMNGVNFENRSIFGTLFQETNLNNANFKDADLSAGAARTIIDYEPRLLELSTREFVKEVFGPHPNVQLLDVNIIDDKIHVRALFYNNFSNSELQNANLQNSNLFYADFKNTNLSGTNLSNAQLNDVNLSGANLSGANLSGANLSGANLSGANLSGANLSGANLIDTILTNSILDCKNHPICSNN